MPTICFQHMPILVIVTVIQQ